MSRGRRPNGDQIAPADGPSLIEASVGRLLPLFEARPQRGPLRGFVLAGPPGAGKSHVCGILGDWLGAHQLASDAIRARLGWAPDNYRAFAVAEGLASALIGRGQSVVLDYNSAKPGLRGKASRRLGSLGAEPVILWIDTPAEIRHARLQGRHGAELDAHEVVVPDEVIERMDAAFFAPLPEEGALRISGVGDVYAQLTELLGPAEPRGIPGVAS